MSYAHRKANGQSVYSVTYDGVAMTRAVSDTIGGTPSYLVGIYYLVDPPVGTHEVQINLNYSDKIMTAAYTLYGVDLYNPIVDTAVRTSYNYVDLTLDVEEAGDMTVTASIVNNLSGLNFGAGQIAQWQSDMSGSGWAMRAGGSTKLATEGGTITVSSDIDPSHMESMIGVVFRALQGDQDMPTPQSPTSTATPTPEPGWSDANYSYDEYKPHAVATIDRGASGADHFGYDDVGNMTDRNEDSVEWTQNFNAEGRLASITDGTDAWSFTYDGDGSRIKQENPDGSTTYFLGGGAYELNVDGTGATSVKKYYALGGQRVLDDDEGLHYMLTDHLGSVVAILDDEGALESSQRFLPFGGLREAQVAETDFGYTGQRNLADIGLMDYNARFYNASIKRFLSADTVGAGNRYAYANNNPMLFVDPSGHKACIDVDSYGRCIVQESPTGNGDVVIIDYTPPAPTHDTAGDVCDNWDIEICREDPEHLPSDRTVDAVVDVAADLLDDEALISQIDYKTLRYNVTALLIAAYQYGLSTEEIAYLMATALGESRLGAIWAGPNATSMWENISKSDAIADYWERDDVAAALGNFEKAHAYLYRGRGFVQLTGWTNYNKMHNRYSWEYGVDILNNPDVVAENVLLSADIAAWGMKNGAFSGYSFDDARNDTRQNGDFYINARRIINSLAWAQGYKDRALKFRPGCY